MKTTIRSKLRDSKKFDKIAFKNRMNLERKIRRKMNEEKKNDKQI